MTKLTEESLTPPIVAHLKSLGWTFDEEKGRWWKTYTDGSVWSENPADHEREFPGDLAAAVLATGPKDVVGDVDPTTTGSADNMSSSQVQNHDANTAFERTEYKTD